MRKLICKKGEGSSRISPQGMQLITGGTKLGETWGQQFQSDSPGTKAGFWIDFVCHTNYFKFLELNVIVSKLGDFR